MIVPQLVYVLCAVTSAICAVLLLRAYAQRQVRLLLWSGLCFCGLVVNNLLLVIDKEILPTRDLSALRAGSGFISAALLVYGLIWETQ